MALSTHIRVAVILWNLPQSTPPVRFDT